jgi:hypothetical protein
LKINIIPLTALVLVLSFSAGQSQTKRTQNDPFRKFVTTLPAVNRIEILSVNTFQTEDAKTVDCTQPDVVCRPGLFPLKITETRKIEGAEAIKVGRLWRNLKRGDPYGGCFLPSHILRFYGNDQLILDSVFCLCGRITLPNIGVVGVLGSMENWYRFRALATPDLDMDRDQRFADHKRELLPQVGKRITIIGVLDHAKLGPMVTFKGWPVYVYATKDSDFEKEKSIFQLPCQIVSLTGTLRYFPEPTPRDHAERAVAVPPEHFYFDIADVTVHTVSKPLPKRAKR